MNLQTMRQDSAPCSENNQKMHNLTHAPSETCDAQNVTVVRCFLHLYESRGFEG